MTLYNARSSPNLAHWCGIWVGRGCKTAIILRFWLTILWEIVTSVWEFYMLKSNIDVFFVTSFLCSLQFFLFHQMEYPKRCLVKKMKFFYGSVFEIWLYFQKQIREGKNTVMFSLTSRDEKTWLRMSPGVRSFRSGFRQRTFCNQPEVSTTSDSKVMTQIVVFMFFGDIDLDLWPIFKKIKI